MRRFNIAYTIGCVAIAVFALQSCVTTTGNLDNINVITKPYSLQFADTLGLIYSTYDGQMIVPLNTTDNSPLEALASTDKYILMVKRGNTRLFMDDGGEGKNHNFNTVYEYLHPSAFGPTMMINLPGYNDTGKVVKSRVYVASSKGRGIAYNDDLGADTTGFWFYPADQTLPQVGGSVTSFARLENGTVVAFDDVSRKVFTKADFSSGWVAHPATGLPASGTGKMYIVHKNNNILAVMLGNPPDNNIWISSDNGQSFTQLPDVPVDDMTCADAPFGKVVIAGTYNNGIWRLDGSGNWLPAYVGLKKGVHINAITYKTNKFKNDKVGEYIYLATSEGVYRSDDMGRSWIDLKVTTTTNSFNVIY